MGGIGDIERGCVEYVISMPNMYARGILWGKMVLELGDSCTARNERNGFLADITFKTKVRLFIHNSDVTWWRLN